MYAIGHNFMSNWATIAIHRGRVLVGYLESGCITGSAGGDRPRLVPA